MKKKLLFLSSLVLSLCVMSVSVSASIGSYQKGYGFQARIPQNFDASHYSTMETSFSALVNTTIDGSVVSAKDYVILSNATAGELDNFINYGNGLTNVFVWKADAQGNITKLYGGAGRFNRFEGYANTSENVTYAICSDKTTPLVYAINNGPVSEGTGGGFFIRPRNSGSYVTYGREDLDLSGTSTFTYKYAYYRGSYGNSVPQIYGFLTQGNDQKLQNPLKKFQIFSILGDGNVRDFDKATNSGATVEVNTVDYTKAQYYYTIQITVENTGESVRAKYKLTKNDGTLVRESDWKEIPEETFDFSQDMGFKIGIYDEYKHDNAVVLGYYDFGTVRQADGKYMETIRIKNSTGSAIAAGAKRISALYDANDDYVSLQIADAPAIANGQTVLLDTEVDIKDTPNFTVKHFLWDNFDDINALGKLDRTKELPTIVCQ